MSANAALGLGWTHVRDMRKGAQSPKPREERHTSSNGLLVTVDEVQDA